MDSFRRSRYPTKPRVALLAGVDSDSPALPEKQQTLTKRRKMVVRVDADIANGPY